MIVFCHSAHETLVREHHPHPNLGRLLSPRQFSRADDTLAEGIPVAADNDCFQRLDRGRYEAMLEAVIGLPVSFIVAPDVVGDAAATLGRFVEWRDTVAECGPVAFVLQDGCSNPPWDEFDCLFLGGTTEWKLGPQTRLLVYEAVCRGKWVHMGRVNTARRMMLAKSWEVNSIDGTSVSRFRRTHLPTRLSQAGAPQQLSLMAVSA